MILTIAIILTIVFIIEIIAFALFWENIEYCYNELSAIEKIARIFIISEIIIIGLLVLLVIFYGISKKLVCDATHNDYKGCEVQEEQVMINE